MKEKAKFMPKYNYPNKQETRNQKPEILQAAPSGQARNQKSFRLRLQDRQETRNYLSPSFHFSPL